MPRYFSPVVPAASVAAVLAFAFVSDANPTVAKKRSCATTGRTIAASGEARLYRSRGAVYACLRDGRRRTIGALEEDGTGEYIFRLAGRYVATDARTCVRGLDCTAALEVRDLRTGRVVRTATVDNDANVIRDLVLTPTGAVAWIRANETTRQVLKLEGSGSPVVLDDGRDVVFGSLALAGSTLYWLRADGPRVGEFGTA